jgi:quinoprotein glucose dehydrogenase
VDSDRRDAGGGSLLLATEGSSGRPVLNAHDKKTGRKLGTVKLPAAGQYGMMSYMHDGKQYIVVQIGGAQYPGSMVALTLP